MKIYRSNEEYNRAVDRMIDNKVLNNSEDLYIFSMRQPVIRAMYRTCRTDHEAWLAEKGYEDDFQEWIADKRKTNYDVAYEFGIPISMVKYYRRG